MDCGQRVEQMWSPSGEGTRMDDFRDRVNRELQLTLSKCWDEALSELRSRSLNFSEGVAEFCSSFHY